MNKDRIQTLTRSGFTALTVTSLAAESGAVSAFQDEQGEEAKVALLATPVAPLEEEEITTEEQRVIDELLADLESLEAITQGEPWVTEDTIFKKDILFLSSPFDNRVFAAPLLTARQPNGESLAVISFSEELEDGFSVVRLTTLPFNEGQAPAFLVTPNSEAIPVILENEEVVAGLVATDEGFEPTQTTLNELRSSRTLLFPLREVGESSHSNEQLFGLSPEEFANQYEYEERDIIELVPQVPGSRDPRNFTLSVTRDSMTVEQIPVIPQRIFGEIDNLGINPENINHEFNNIQDAAMVFVGVERVDIELPGGVIEVANTLVVAVPNPVPGEIQSNTILLKMPVPDALQVGFGSGSLVQSRPNADVFADLARLKLGTQIAVGIDPTMNPDQVHNFFEEAGVECEGSLICEALLNFNTEILQDYIDGDDLITAVIEGEPVSHALDTSAATPTLQTLRFGGVFFNPLGQKF